MTGDDYATRSEVAGLRRRVAMLEAVVGQMSRRRVLAPADHEWLLCLLPAIVSATDGDVWALPDLATRALLPMNAALASALAPHTERDGGLRALGKALARCAGHCVNGLELVRVGECRDGGLWMVRRV